MLRYHVILNPAAARGRAAHARHAIERALTDAGATFDLLETQGTGDAIRLAQAARQAGVDVVAAAGGDGTAHEVVKGLIAATADAPPGSPAGVLAVIPVGTGNDYAWRLGLPDNDPEAACRIMLGNRRQVVDLAQVTDERGQSELILNHLGGGFEAAAAVESSRIKRLRGLLLYLVAVLRIIPQYHKGRTVTVTYNGEHQTRRILLASVSNGGRSGGGFKIAPAAQLDDGELDLVLADSPNVAVILYLLPHFLRGTHVSKTRYVSVSRITHVRIDAPDGLPVHVDGDILRTDARCLEVSVLPRRLEVIVG